MSTVTKTSTITEIITTTTETITAIEISTILETSTTTITTTAETSTTIVETSTTLIQTSSTKKTTTTAESTRENLQNDETTETTILRSTIENNLENSNQKSNLTGPILTTSSIAVSYICPKNIGILNRTILKSCVKLNSPDFMDLIGKNIFEIDPHTFDNSNFTRLSLSENKLKKIEANTFGGLSKSLIFLSLRKNYIETIDKMSFAHLSSLTTLNLQQNNLTSIDAQLFKGLQNLTDLNIGYNQIHSIDPQIFSGLNKLETLELDEICHKCKESTGWSFQIKPDFFHNISKSLKKLYLGNLFNGNISSVLLHGMSNLQHLKISYNNLKEIDPNLFRDLENLIKLDLYQNEVHTIKNDTFGSLKRLEELDFHHNQLGPALDENTFDNLLNLRSLKLHNNNLESIPKSLYEKGTSLNVKDLDLRYNPISNDTLQEIQSKRTSLNPSFITLL
jgi:Leucine-rich repeat (LRR) protein